LAEDSNPRNSSEKSEGDRARMGMESEQKMGRCPWCSTFYYFHPKLNQNLSYLDNRCQAVAMSSSLENQLISKKILEIEKDHPADNSEVLDPGAARISKEETMVNSQHSAAGPFLSESQVCYVRGQAGRAEGRD
jgi:hypothetical protein